MAKVKAFDPSKARTDAEKTITAAEVEIAKLQEKVEPAEKKVAEAEQKQKDAAAAKQKQVDAAKTKLAEVKADIAEREEMIERSRRYLKATANLDATDDAVAAAPEGETVDNGEPAVV
jgi:peptidoglycan hydrolase CwlO-like protein